MLVSEGIHRLTRGVTNFYLIGESGKYALVDAGAPADWAFFSSAPVLPAFRKPLTAM
jgi:hypothetical protein